MYKAGKSRENRKPQQKMVGLSWTSTSNYDAFYKEVTSNLMIEACWEWKNVV